VTQKHSASTENLASSVPDVVSTLKTVLITFNKVSIALSFKGQLVARAQQDFTQDQGVTFAVLDLSNESPVECPVSVFYQTLILLFAPEPKIFLVNDERYLKPILYTDTEQTQVVAYKELKHRGQYKLKF
jgi:hypothetical protein